MPSDGRSKHAPPRLIEVSPSDATDWEGDNLRGYVSVECWWKKEGDNVERGELLVEISTTSGTFEIHSPSTGILVRTFARAWERIRAETVIALIEEREQPHKVEAGPQMTGEPNGSSQDRVPAAPLSPEFLGGSTEAGLEKIRTRLLDLTNRNRLLNFRHSVASSLRVVDADLNAVFRRLMDGDKLAFLPVPEPEDEVLVHAEPTQGERADALPPKPSATEYAQALGWNTSYDVDTGSTGDSDCLPVLHYLEGLETLTRKIGSAAKTAIEESGTNMLYLTLGLLEWYEADESQQPRLAPLLMVPVALDRSAGKGRGFECTIEYSGDDFTTNLSLLEKMRLDFALEIPSVEDDDTPEQYFARFAPILTQKKRWRIRPQITLSLLSFGKLLMYRDLNPRTWPGIATHQLVRELFEGRKSDTITHAEEYLIDDEDRKDVVPPPIIHDADSSQHSALIDALRGQNLVVEGPPGTGKSQTITNLIAAVLVGGKTVLFVSEKLAALEVVRRRLDEAGLGLFCLELHSHKTKKDALLKDLAARIKAHRSFHDPRDLDQHLSAVRETKRLLTRYAELINKRIEPFLATVFEILWARDLLYQKLPFRRELVEQLLLPSVLSFTRSQLAQSEQFLAVYAQHMRAVLNVCSDVNEHPWRWIAKTLSFGEEERIVDLLEKLVGAIGESDELRRSLEDAVAISLDGSIDGLARASQLMSAVPETSTGVNERLLAPCRDPKIRKALSDLVLEVNCALAAIKVLGESTANGNPDELLREDTARAIADAFETSKRLSLEKSCASQLRQLLETGRAAEGELAEAERCFSELLTLLGCEIPFGHRTVELLLNCIRALEGAPLDILHLRSQVFEEEGAGHAIREAAGKANALHQRREALKTGFDLPAATSIGPARLREHAGALDEASLWRVWFGRDFKSARRSYRRIAVGRPKAARDEMARSVRALADHLEECARFDGDPAYRQALGWHFNGLETRWNEVQQLVAWYEEVFTLLPDQEDAARVLRHVLLTTRTDRLRASRAGLRSVQRHREVLERVHASLPKVLGTLPVPASVSRPAREIQASLRQVNAQLEELLASLHGADIKEDVPLDRIPDLIRESDSYRRSVECIDQNHLAQELLGDGFAGIQTDVEPIRGTVAFAEFVSGGALTRGAVDWILADSCEERIRQLRGWLSEAASCADKLRNIGRELDAISGSTVWATEREPLEALQKRARLALANIDELLHWIHFCRVRAESRDAGLEKLTRLAESRALEPQQLVPAFHFVFYNTLARGVFVDHPELSAFSGVTQEHVRQQFAQADKRAIQLYRERAASIIDHRPAPYGNQTGPVGSWTELALINHEINKQKRHIPIRRLVRRAGRALQAIKPCFMMGPLSVAQYLEPGRLKFDLVVMDEASQLKPEDAIGSIARGGQIVVVGDPKQLPPTNFFQRVAIDDDEEDDENRTVVEEGESILDVASTLYQPVRRLRWHYRSRHQSLIAFSNREFYQGDLVIFPSAYHEDPSLGVRYHPVPSGTFENRRNPREAEAVVQAVLEHMETRPDESLGVVTLNFEQRELIEELLDRRLREEAFAAAYQERMNSGPEPFFIKNLENVQGDERDVIFISVTYGPDPRGNQYQRFGPITGPNGHRRLNVLFTRAKKRTEVFSSLDPDKIQIGGTSWGVRVLKQYLTFARSGVLEMPTGDGEQPTNDFEESVGAILRGNGFDVVSQVGVAGFFIDLAVRNPVKPGTFVLGIECDGATYHSGRSARDRDRLRQEILENLGWKIHRIWSTDWFKSRSAEIKRLLKRLEQVLADDPDYRRERERAQRIESIRDQLTTLKETEIKPAFPDSPEEKCLLRQILLEEFVRKRPRTREDWFKMIPYELRSATDAAQVGRYLPKVLEIINDSFDSEVK